MPGPLPPGWVGPWWLERQADPASPAFVASSANLTGRSWTVVGALGSDATVSVDPRGLVMVPGRWSLDWWIGADDRWHLPSREPAVRQALMGDAPVVETRMRIPSGDAVQRVYAIREPGGAESVVVEVENASPVPVALAFALRPYDGTGTTEVGGIELVGGTRLVVDDLVAVLLPRPPSRVAESSGDGGRDVAEVVLAGEAGEAGEASEAGSAGDGSAPIGRDWLATAALIYPLPHTAVLRVVLPVPSTTRRATWPEPLPDVDPVVRGWRSQGDRGVRLELPDDRLASAVAASRRSLLVRRGAPPEALGLYGYEEEAAAGLRRLLVDDGAAALVPLARHWRLYRDDDLTRELAPEVAAVAESLLPRRRRRRRGGREAAPVDPEALLAAAQLLDAGGETVAALDARSAARSLPPLRAEGTLELHDHAVVDRLVGGLDPALTARVALGEVGLGEPVAFERLEWLLGTASPTWTWPERVHPRLGTGCAGDGHSLEVAGAFLELVRGLLVLEDGRGGLALCPLLPEAWRGVGIELHDAPTELGWLSFALRWHGERPALLWELQPHEGAGPVRLSAPGLDPAWSTTEVRGDALLGTGATGPPATGSAPAPAPAPPPAPDQPPYLLPEAGSFS